MPIAKRRAALPALTGGINYSPNVLSVKPNQAQRIVNMHIDEQGRAFTRKGSRLLAGVGFDNAVTSIYDYRRPDGSGGTTSTLLVTVASDTDAQLYSVDSAGATTLVASLDGHDRPTWATFLDGSANSVAFMCNGTDFIMYDGTTVTDVTGPWTDAPRYITEYDERLIAAGSDSDPYTVWVSNLLNGTTWTEGSPAAAVYWTVKGAKGDKVTGLSRVYDFLAIFQQFGVTVINEADPGSSTSQQIQVSTQYGTSSHWSIQSIGNILYFCDEAHIYRAILREGLENGLLVEPIDENIVKKYQGLTNATDVVSVYDARNKEIQWGIRTKNARRNDVSLVYNVGLSNRASSDAYMSDKYVWSGWFTGDSYEPYTFGVVLTSDGESVVYRGDESGNVYVMDERKQWKDSIVLNTPTSVGALCKFDSKNYGPWFRNDIITLEFWFNIPTGAEASFLFVAAENGATPKTDIRYSPTLDKVWISSGGKATLITPVVFDTWYHIVVVYNKTTLNRKVYVGTLATDDALVDDSTMSGFPSSLPMKFFFNNTASFGTTSPYMSDIRVWGVERSLAEINANKFSYVSPTSNLFANWRLDKIDGYDGSVHDYSLYGMHGFGFLYRWIKRSSNKDIPSELRLAPLSPYGIAIEKRCRDFIPYLYQKYDGSTLAQWVIDGRIVEPDAPEAFALRGNVAYWNDESTDITTEWDSTVWNEEPVTPHVVTVNEPFRYIQFILTCLGTNDRDEISYAGAEVWYQPHRLNRVL